jgi:hypothetical protein
MYHHPNTILAMHEERQLRLEVEAAHYAFKRSLRRHRRSRWRRWEKHPSPLQLKPQSP